MVSFWKQHYKEHFLFIFLICLGILLLEISGKVKGRFAAATFFSQKILNQAFSPPKVKSVSLASLRKQNQALQQKVNKFVLAKSLIEEVRRENQRLRAQLGYKQSSNLNLIAARVVGHEPTNWFNMSIIDKGILAGVKMNDGVIAFQDGSEGFVGKIIEVADNHARVLLIRDSASRIGGCCEQTRYTGIIEGQNKNLLLFKYLPQNAKLEVSEGVITSGESRLFPAGIKIGQIAGWLPQKYPTLQRVEVRPYLDFDRLEEVFVIQSSPANLRLMSGTGK